MGRKADRLRNELDEVREELKGAKQDLEWQVATLKRQLDDVQGAHSAELLELYGQIKTLSGQRGRLLSNEESHKKAQAESFTVKMQQGKRIKALEGQLAAEKNRVQIAEAQSQKDQKSLLARVKMIEELRNGVGVIKPPCVRCHELDIRVANLQRELRKARNESPEYTELARLCKVLRETVFDLEEKSHLKSKDIEACHRVIERLKKELPEGVTWESLVAKDRAEQSAVPCQCQEITHAP